MFIPDSTYIEIIPVLTSLERAEKKAKKKFEDLQDYEKEYFYREQRFNWTEPFIGFIGRYNVYQVIHGDDVESELGINHDTFTSGSAFEVMRNLKTTNNYTFKGITLLDEIQDDSRVISLCSRLIKEGDKQYVHKFLISWFTSSHTIKDVIDKLLTQFEHLNILDLVLYIGVDVNDGDIEVVMNSDVFIDHDDLDDAISRKYYDKRLSEITDKVRVCDFGVHSFHYDQLNECCPKFAHNYRDAIGITTGNLNNLVEIETLLGCHVDGNNHIKMPLHKLGLFNIPADYKL